jgi:ABC-type Zn uptake system ZnuABC Zn-binding protein ZnuA
MSIPEHQRVLATAHSAFNYLCRDYGFRAVPVRGLNTAQTASPQHVRKVIDELRGKHVRILFPEWNTNPSVLASLLREAHLHLAPPLLADTTNPDKPSFENMFQYNVETITTALLQGHPES